jgi:hypothetical protein
MGEPSSGERVPVPPPTEKPAQLSVTDEMKNLEAKVVDAQKGDLLARMENEGKIAKTDKTDEETNKSGAKKTEDQTAQTTTQTEKTVENQSNLGGDTNIKKEAETKLPAESPIVPGKVANNPEFKKTWGDLYAQAGVGGKEVNVAAIDKQALSDYYDKSAKIQFEQGLSDEVKNDPLYQRELGKTTAKAQEKGEPLDGKKLSQEALAKFQYEKDLQDEKPEESKESEEDRLGEKNEEKTGPQGKETTGTEEKELTTDEKVKNIIEGFNKLLENKDIESAKVTLPAKDLLSLLKAYAEANEPDAKKKEARLTLLQKFIAVIANIVLETTKVAIPSDFKA